MFCWRGPPSGKAPAWTNEYSTYTGPLGFQGHDYSVKAEKSNQVTFVTTRPLRPGEGLTIAVSWPKGVIPEPVFADQMGDLLRDNTALIPAIIGLLITFLYYLWAWSRVGRDPAKGTIIPRFAPPDGFSPAATSYVMRMGYSDTVFAATIVNMAVKGYVTIREDDDEFEVTRTEADESVLSEEERKIAKKLLGESDSIEFTPENHGRISNAIEALKKSLKRTLEKTYFHRNSTYLIPGVLLTLLILAGMVLQAPQRKDAALMAAWLLMWTVGCVYLVLWVLKPGKGVLYSGGTRKMVGVFGKSLFTLPFVGGEVFGLWALSSMTSPIVALILLLVVFVDLLFYRLLKAPTPQGRMVMDEIEGFKMYLSVAEKDRLNILNPPHTTPELFEKFLPYALALGVEHAWSEQFSNELERASYSPTWYSGRNWSTLGAAGLASTLGSSLPSVISSSSSPPGSRSGSGGGGFSGGGGGGGGGGGW